MQKRQINFLNLCISQTHKDLLNKHCKSRIRNLDEPNFRVALVLDYENR